MARAGRSALLIAIGRLRAGAPEAVLFAHYAARLRPPLALVELPEGRGGSAAEIRHREGDAASPPDARTARRPLAQEEGKQDQACDAEAQRDEIVGRQPMLDAVAADGEVAARRQHRDAHRGDRDTRGPTRMGEGEAHPFPYPAARPVASIEGGREARLHLRP